MARFWNDTDRQKRRTPRKSCLNVKLFTINLTCTGVGSNQALRSDNMGDVDKDWNSFRSDVLQFTRHAESHPIQIAFSETPFFILHSLHLSSYCMGKYTTVDNDASCSSPPRADLPEVSMYLFTGMCASSASTASFVIISLFLYQTKH